jgi:hypothetical protein
MERLLLGVDAMNGIEQCLDLCHIYRARKFVFGSANSENPYSCARFGREPEP